MMKIEQNKAIVRDYLNEIVNKGNMSAFDTFFSEDVVFNEARNFREQYPARMQAIRGAFPDHHLIIRDQIAEGDKVLPASPFTARTAAHSMASPQRESRWNGRELR